MFCDGCGMELAAGQQFCSRCGKQVVGGAHPAYPRRGRVQGHLRLLGILWLALSAINAVGGAALLIIANTLFPHLHEMGGPPVPAGFLQSFVSVIGFAILAKAAVGFAAGWGLLQKEPWARVLTLVLAFISLFHVPFGTALGIYSLWVLLPAPSEEEYAGMAKAA
jgi:hypothetical protein